MSLQLTNKVLGMALIGFGAVLSISLLQLIPPSQSCQYSPTCTIINLNPYLGGFYFLLGISLYFRVGGEIIKDRRWFLTVLTLVPMFLYFLELDFTQGGPFGTFKAGGITLEHEGIGFGILAATTFFPKRRDALWLLLLGTGLLFVILEVAINQLADIYVNPFGIFFSSLLGFIISYGLLRSLGHAGRIPR